jgi:hypothetical protein
MPVSRKFEPDFPQPEQYRPPENFPGFLAFLRWLYGAFLKIATSINNIDYQQCSFMRHSITQVTDANGRVDISYDKEFALQPDVTCTFEDAGTNVYGVKIHEHSGAKPPYTGVIIQLYNPGTGADIATASVPVTVHVQEKREASTVTVN